MAWTEQEAREYAAELHSRRNLLYGGKPYEVHLSHVVEAARPRLYLLNASEEENLSVLCACWLHDTLEDCAITYNDLAERFGALTADIVYDVTNELGKNRKERAERTYPKIAANRFAKFVKLSDRLANATHSRDAGHHMFAKYADEYASFKKALYREGEFEPFWLELDRLHSVTSDVF